MDDMIKRRKEYVENSRNTVAVTDAGISLSVGGWDWDERNMWIRIIKEWLRWRKNWDDLCSRCGKCCYARSVARSGKVTVDYSDPCPFLDTRTNLCEVFEERFQKCRTCGKVGLWTALFNPTLPEDCSYVQTFRHLLRSPKERRE